MATDIVLILFKVVSGKLSKIKHKSIKITVSKTYIITLILLIDFLSNKLKENAKFLTFAELV